MIKGQWLCRCEYDDCDGGYISKRLKIASDEYQDMIVGYDIITLSGYRCPKHNVDSGGSPTSKHMSGDAWDFTIPGLYVPEMVQIAERVPYFFNGGIGAYIDSKTQKGRVHCDVRRGTARWLYIDGEKQTYKQMVRSGIFSL